MGTLILGLIRFFTPHERFDLFGSLPDTIEAEWIENIEALDKRLDEYIDALMRKGW